MRHDFGFCTGPLRRLRDRKGLPRPGGERRLPSSKAGTIQPLDRVINEMQQAAEAGEFERATIWRGDSGDWHGSSPRLPGPAPCWVEALSFCLIVIQGSEETTAPI